MVLLKNVSKSYRDGVYALCDISLEIGEGESVYITSPTGRGESTPIRLLDGGELPDAGEVYVAGANVEKLRHSRVPFYHRNVGVAFQDFHLLPKMTVFGSIAFALEVLTLGKVVIRRRVRGAPGLVSLQDKAKSFPNQLSGGQQQRATVARAITNHPKVLIADEPTGNLDPEKSMKIIKLLDKISRVEGTTIIVVTHNSTLVNTYEERTIVLEDGLTVADIAKGGYIHHD